MTVLKIYSEKETKEETKFGIEIEQFYMQFHYEGKVHEIHKEDLKDFYAIYILGINSG